jgi:hypothetical protein
MFEISRMCLLDLWCPSSIPTVHNILEQAPPTFSQLWHDLVSDQTVHAFEKGPLHGTDMTHWP